VEKFQKFRFADVGKSELGKKEERNMRITLRSTVHRTGDLISARCFLRVNSLSVDVCPFLAMCELNSRLHVSVCSSPANFRGPWCTFPP